MGDIMFGPRALTSGLSLTKVIGGISKTLGMVNQIIPIYKEAKPIISNAGKAISFIREFSNTTTNHIITNTNKNIGPIKEKINKQILNNQKGPTFFQ